MAVAARPERRPTDPTAAVLHADADRRVGREGDRDPGICQDLVVEVLAGGGVGRISATAPADHRPAGPAPRGVRVRAGVGGDLDRIWLLYRQSFPIGRRTEDVWRRWLDEREVLVAERDGETVAFVHIEPVAGWITHVGVAEEARGLGVGGFLFSTAVEDWWQERPESELRLSIKPDNMPAIRLYRRLGFEPAGVEWEFLKLPLRSASP